MRREIILDSFAGGGGASTGITLALGRSPDIAINHDPEALSMHRRNHPTTKHYPHSVWDVSPRDATGGRPVGLAWFSPDCTFFSKSRGGRPFRERNTARRRRGLAWIVIKWAEQVRPRVIFLENVEEFEDWGPLGDDGKPDKERAGFTFRRWVKRLENLGYRVEWRQLRACDYGAPTIRKRLFLVARCDGKPVAWPEPTHGPGRPLPWRTAAECIDWTIPCPSVFLTREEARAFRVRRPLAENTMKRVARGVWKYVLTSADPFVVPVKSWGGGGNEPASIHAPLRTTTTSKRGEYALVAPFLTEHANASKQRTFRADEPLRTQTAEVAGGHFSLVAPTLIQTGYGERKGQAPRSLDILAPVGTLMAEGNKHAVVSAFLAKHYTGVTGQDVRQPMGTVTTVDHHSVVTAAFTASHYGTSVGAPADAPLRTATAQSNHHSVVTAQLGLPFPAPPAPVDRRHHVRAFLTHYYGPSVGQPVRTPLNTVTTKDRFGIVTVQGRDYEIVDIGLRMFKPRELYTAQGFPLDYVIDRGVDDEEFTVESQVRMVGNSVSPPVAAALVHANCAELALRQAA